MRPHGRAVIDAGNPSRAGLCDRCGFLFLLKDLRPQYLWAGQKLVDTGYLVCECCLDEPAPFERAIVLPPDPPPALLVRPNGSINDDTPGITVDNTSIDVSNLSITVDDTE